ncbi:MULTISPECIES: hypothetical protein [unclassified Cyanobium]|uniref:hypothetical protein n=1 Tax=unclassified Cyanobium TaxID=2627006 RepID=UPI0020CC8CEA|nr:MULTISPECIES: hypothetical protein [unclassified Cyanobium]MCP9835700.1 hypothetical protein [Cyanobium sp. La Preciosa 7G6]MCP9938475.1 hypothetical protein [Cyanobium sp. Aljojuca 7A6]
MDALKISIVSPDHDAVLIAPVNVIFKGREDHRPPSLAAVPLYFRWYSSLNRSANKGRYSLNETALPFASSDYEESDLPLGSQVIGFAATDQRGESEAEIRAIRHGAYAGGDQTQQSPCVIHVLRATIVNPPLADPPPAVPRQALKLQAEAPDFWDNPTYQAVNQLRYSWILSPAPPPAGWTPRWMPPPQGLPANRPRLTFEHDPSARDPSWQFTAPSQAERRGLLAFTPALSPQGPLPPEAIGPYECTLEVAVKARTTTAKRTIDLLP